MGTNPAALSGGEHPRWPSGRKLVATRLDLGALDFEHRRAVAHAGCYPNYKTVHRRFQTWCRNEILRQVLTDIADELRERGALDEEECFIDATFAMAKGGAEIGATKRGKGLKIMAIVDRHGLSLSRGQFTQPGYCLPWIARVEPFI
jgi:hypothetical protein